MKDFKNQQTEITTASAEGKVINMSYSDLAKLTLNITPQQGWTKDEMKLRFKIEDKLDNIEVGKKGKLEDAEFAKILECSNQPWQFKHKDLVKYLDDLDTWSKKD